MHLFTINHGDIVSPTSNHVYFADDDEQSPLFSSEQEAEVEGVESVNKEKKALHEVLGKSYAGYS